MPDTQPDDSIVRELTAALGDRYALERELGRGGMGAVFLARDLRLDRPVAVKVLPPELAVRPELRERFLRETRVAASFSHPNIVPVYSVEESPGLLYFVMAYVEGETLTQRVRRQGPLTATDAVRLMQEVAWALSYAHGRGVIHRDVKPDNILLERATGRALVMDFGIARSAAASGLTQLGEAVGTPHFMSPEQAAGDRVDARSDLYSLGVVGYFAVTARLPFDGESAQAIMVAHISATLPSVASYRPDLPAPLTQAIDRCLAKVPEQRYASGEELVAALEGARGRQVEVPPAIRLWVARSDQWFRNGLILALLTPTIVGRFQADGDQLIFGAVFAVATLSLWAQVPIAMRSLARQGFTFQDVRTGVGVVDEERVAVLQAMRADPSYGRRRRNQLLLCLAGIVASVVVISLALASRVPLSEPNSYRMGLGWAAAAFAAASVGMASFVFFMAIVAGSGRMDRRLHRLWRGRIGAALFRLGCIGLRGRSELAIGSPTRLGPLALLDTIDPESRRGLGRVRGTLEQLEGEVERLARRERELDAAAAEARSSLPSLGAGPGNEQQRLLDDLERARSEATERRVAVLACLERIRLGLVRVKTRIGAPDEVARTVADAAQVLKQPSAVGRQT